MRLPVLLIIAGIGLVSMQRALPQTAPPAWLAAKIVGYEKGAPGLSPTEIWTYEVDGHSVYYVRAPCCDLYNQLFDADGRYLCAPDGGFAGGGDRKCTQAQKVPDEMKIVWRNPRLGLRVKPNDTTK